VPEVDFRDIKAVRDFMQDMSKGRPQAEGHIGLCASAGLYQSVCSPGADARAIWYRHAMLALIEDLLKAAYPGGQWSEAALKSVASMELTWLPVSEPQKGFPFDVIEFLARARAEAAA
jgi:hypothetical protein